MHVIKFVKKVVDLVDCYLSRTVLVNYSKHRLVFLLVNRKFLLHFARLRIQQQSLWVYLVVRLRMRILFFASILEFTYLFSFAFSTLLCV